MFGETIWLSPRVAANDNQFGGDDGVGGYAPLAVVTGSGTSAVLSWIHGNHLGVPLVFSNASGTAVSPPSYTLPGFPGQLKTLSDIYYNRYRDYDSSTGRYIQADPIGLEGGSNDYLYAGGNPLRYTDPLGLSPSTGEVAEIAFEWWLKRQLRPARNTPLGRFWGIGEGIGTALGVAKFVCEQNDHDEDCLRLITEINELRNELARRVVEWREDKGQLSVLPGPNSRPGHMQQYREKQLRLRRKLEEADYKRCKGYAPDAWYYASKSLDRRF